jgi:tetratricopeptide (TPR) repeat protein
MSLSPTTYLSSFRDTLKTTFERDSDIKKTTSDALGSILSSRVLDASQISSFGIGIGLAFLGQYLATKKRGSRAARVIAKILGADVDAINRDFVLAKLKDKKYLESIREKILNVIKTKSIDEFAASLDPPLSPGEAWTRQIKDVILDAEIIDTVSQASNQISSLLPAIHREALRFRTAIDEQMKELKQFHDQLETSLYQSYGLNWLANDYFEKHSVQEQQELGGWKEGSPFKLESIYGKLEFRRNIVDEIEAKLKNQDSLLILGEAGTSKTTILMEIICDYFNDDYEILYNWGTGIRNGEQLANFIENKIMDRGNKVLVVVDNVHNERAAPIFLVMDRLSRYILKKNVKFILAARLPEFTTLVKEGLGQIQEGREEIREFATGIGNSTRKQELKFFTKPEIKEFIKTYLGKGLEIKYKQEGSNYFTKLSAADDELLDPFSQAIFQETKGGIPILVKFYLFGGGLLHDVQRRYEDYLQGDSEKIKTILVCSLLDIASLPITEKLLDDMKLLKYAYDLERKVLYYFESEKSWKTIHTRWDTELLSYLYNIREEEKGILYRRREYLENGLNAIFNLGDQKISSPIIQTIYNIVASRIIPMNIIEAVFRMPEYLSDSKKVILYTFFISNAYSKLGKYQEALDTLSKANIITPDFAPAWINKGVLLSQLGKYEEATKCYDKAIELQQDNMSILAWDNKATMFSTLGRREDEIKCYDEIIKIDPNNVLALHNKGHILRDIGKYEEAIKSYDKALEINSNDAVAWRNKGFCFFELGKSEEARECYDKSLDIDPNSAIVWYNRGLATAKLGKYEEALINYDKSMEMKPYNREDTEMKPDYADVTARKAEALLELGNYEEAIRWSDKAIEMNANHLGAWSCKAVSLENLGRTEEAIKCWDKILQIDPNNSVVWRNKGGISFNLGKYEEAIKYYDKTLGIDSTDVIAWRRRGFSFGRLGSYREAIASLDKAIEIDPNDADVWSHKSMALYMLGNYTDAIRSSDQAIEIDPNSADALLFKGLSAYTIGRNEECLVYVNKFLDISPPRRYINLLGWLHKGLALGNLGRHEEAITCFDKALEIDPNSADAWYNKAFSLAELNRYEDAIRCYDKTTAVDPMYKLAWNNKGILLYELKMYDDSIKYYDKTLEIDPIYWGAWFNKGLSLDSLERYDEAIKSYDKALAIDASYIDAWNNKGLALDNLGRYDEAIKSYDKALAIDANNAGAWYNKGLALDNLGRYEEAIQSYDKAIEIDSNHVPAVDSKSYALFKLGQDDEAINCSNEAIEKEPNYANAWYNRAVYKIHKKDIKNGFVDLKKAIEIGKEEYIKSASQDSDFDSVRDTEEFKEILGIKNN